MLEVRPVADPIDQVLAALDALPAADLAEALGLWVTACCSCKGKKGGVRFVRGGKP